MRLFVAAWPPAGVVSLLAALPRTEVKGLRWTRRDQWHVTLRFLGNVEDVDGVVAALRAAPVGRTEAVMGPAVSRFGHRVLHVPVDGLSAAASAVVRATAGFGEPPENRPFRGHVTLARAADRARVDLRPLAGTPLSGTWPVDEVTLVASRLSPAGARYEIVERFPTSG
ncbi:MAG: RNA 2',3'-cyclic phosphodiesterase [Acidimicrobiia bacterium]